MALGEVPVYFALVTPRPGAHAELLQLLQIQVVAPLIGRGLLSEFRVLTATPPSFVAAAATLLVFELVVPCPWPITDQDVEQWQKRLGHDVRLVVAPSHAPRSGDSWDAHRARSVLARAMVLPPALKVPAGRPSWISACVDRSATAPEGREVVSATAGEMPCLTVVEEATGRRLAVAPRSTLLSAALAWEICQHLPVSLRWKTAWRLAYSPRVHGVSLATFFRRMDQEGPSLLMIQDHHGSVFGGFASATWHAGDRYFGSGESFVFKFRRPLPKPVLPLAQQAQLLAKGAPSGGSAGSTSAGAQHAPGGCGSARSEPVPEAARDTFQQALRIIGDWDVRVRREAARGERAAAEAGHITSPTEALDELLGVRGPVSAVTGLAAAAAAAASSGPAVAAAPTGARPPASPEDAASVTAEHQEDEEVDDDPGLQVFHWCNTDPFFLFSDMECLAMGGGSTFALYLEKDLLHGMSEPCSTFGSEQLASVQNFIISDMECWVFDDPTEQLVIPLRPPQVCSAGYDLR